MGEREPTLEVVIGQKGVGKTWTTKEIICGNKKKGLKGYIEDDPETGRRGRPALVFDINGEYTDFKIQDFDVEEPDEWLRASEIRGIVVPKGYRIIPYRKDKRPMTPDEIIITCTTITNHFKNGLMVLEDINRYILSNLKVDIIGLLVGLRHIGTDLIIHYQALKPLPPRIWQNVNYIRWHKQTVNIDVYKKNIPNYELFKIAENIVDEQYKKGKIRYYLWVGVMDEGLINVTGDMFDRAARRYLSQNPREVKALMLLEDDSGAKKYQSSSEATRSWIEERRILYLPSGG